MADKLLHERVGNQVREMIEAGVLKPGDRAPSLRQMSRRNQVSLSTVSQAYASLERLGLLEARPKSGFFVRLEPDLPRPKVHSPRPVARRVRVTEMLESILGAIQDPDIVSLGVANPLPEILPTRQLARLSAQIARAKAAESVRGAGLLGSEMLRRQISYRLADRGAVIPPDELMVTNGATEALSIALRVVAKPGDVIAVESPTYFFVLQLIERLGMLALEIKTDPDTGLDVTALEDVLDYTNISAVVSIPTYANPLGSLMPDETKARLVRLLAARDIPLIEDDISGDLGHDGEKPRLAKSFDEQNRVIVCSSFSKTLAPGFRVGWLAPGRFLRPAFHWKQSVSAQTAALPQLVVGEFLRSGAYETFVGGLASTYRNHAELMRHSIARSFPVGTRVTRPRGGCVVWVELPRGLDTGALFTNALARDVSYVPGMLFSPTRRYRNSLRLACARPWNDEVASAVERLGELFCENLKSTS